MTAFLDLEPRIVARLAELAPAGVLVQSVADIAGTTVASQVTPAIQVFYGGYRVLQTRSNKSQASIEQTWYAVAVVRHAGAQLSGAAARQAAGPLIDLCLSALMGWSPGPPWQAMELTNAPAPKWLPGGLGYHPVGFKTVMPVSAGHQQGATT